MVEVDVHAYGLSVEQQDELWQRWREGEALRSVARQLGTPVQKVRRYVAQTGGVWPRLRCVGSVGSRPPTTA